MLSVTTMLCAVRAPLRRARRRPGRLRAHPPVGVIRGDGGGGLGGARGAGLQLLEQVLEVVGGLRDDHVLQARGLEGVGRQ